MFYQKILSESSPYVVSVSKNAGHFPLHKHYEVEIHYCKLGSMVLRIGEKEYKLTDGTLAIIGSMTPHSLVSKADGTHSVLIELGPFFLKEHFSTFTNLDLDDPIIVLNEDSDKKELTASLHELIDNSYASDTCSKLSGIGCLWKICSQIIMIKGTNADIINKKRDQRIERILDHIHIHYTEPISLDDAVALVGYSKGNLCKVFKEAVGMSFHSYLNNYRIQSSLYLLKNTDMPIGEIAENVGFTEFKSFCRVFKSVIGITPSEFRK